MAFYEAYQHSEQIVVAKVSIISSVWDALSGMNPQKFSKIYTNLPKRQKEVLLRLLKGETDKEIGEKLEIQETTVRKHIERTAQAFGIQNRDSDGRTSKRLELMRLFSKYNPELLSQVANATDSELLEIKSAMEPNQTFDYIYPDSPLDVNSPLYIERPPRESLCYERILKTSALIRIKAPKQFGKTSLMDRILHHTSQKGYKNVRLNLTRLDEQFLTSLDQFLKWLCNRIAAELKLESQVDSSWDAKNMGGMVSCTNYFQEHLLSLDTPLVLAFDGVDKLFQYSEIAQNFFPLLRTWHEESNNIEIWGQLRLVLTHSTSAYIPLSINVSPFNVGLPIELQELNREQVWELVQRYQIPKWSINHAEQLMAMVGGHPFLIQLALYHIQRGDFTLEEILKTAIAETGIYISHLQEYSHYLRADTKLSELFKKVLARGKMQVNDDQLIAAYKLNSKGLVKMQGNDIEISCDLYRQYFQKTLNKIEDN